MGIESIMLCNCPACLLRFIMPDSLWRDTSALSGKSGAKAALKGPVDPPSTAEVRPDTAPQDIKATVSQSIEAEGIGGDSEPVVPDGQLMDEATKAEVMRRARIVTEVRSGGYSLRII